MILKRYFFYQTLIETNFSRFETTNVAQLPISFRCLDLGLMLLQKIIKFMIPLSLLAASKFYYSDTKLPYDQYMNKMEIPDNVLFLYDNTISIVFPEVENQRYMDDADILRSQVERYKNGLKPDEIDEDFFFDEDFLNVKRVKTIAGHLIE